VRKVIDRSEIKYKNILRTSTVLKTYCRVTGTDPVDFHFAEAVYGFWAEGFLSNKLKDFCFRYTNNQLSTNTRLSHYVLNVNRSCFFCASSGNPDPPDETFLHLFYQCPVTERTHLWFCGKYFDNDPNIDRKAFFFKGRSPGLAAFNKLGFLIAMVVQWLIWDMKVNRRTVQPLTLNNDFVFIIENCIRISGCLREERNKLQALTNIPPAWLI
jgi:hypothetical protein